MRSDIKTVTSKVLLMLAAMSALLAAVSLTNAQGGKKPATPAGGPFTGVWDTRSAGSYKYTVRLTQVGTKVTGTYAPGNGKIFDGVVVGNKVTFKWTQDDGYEGTGEFTLDDDRKGFTGSSTATKPGPQTNTWSTYRPAPPESFAGTWDTTVNNVDVNIPLTIVQKGAKVTGIYPAQNGKLEGTVDGRVLRFKWESDKGSGSGSFMITGSGLTFGGTFNKGTDPKVVEGYWNGERKSPGTSKDTNTNQDTDAGIDDTTKGGTGGKTMASFAGVWSVIESGSGGGMELAQFGPIVKGYYGTNQRSYEFKDATVNGSILRFRLVALDATGSTRVGEVKMDPGGKSFKGTIGGMPATGKFERAQ